MWWRMPSVEKPRKEGEVDFRGASWIAASSANWRRADRPDDFGIDRVIIHVTQGSLQERGEGLPGPRPWRRHALHCPSGRPCHADDPGTGRGVPRGQPRVQRAKCGHRARGFRGPAAGLHGCDVRGVGPPPARICARYDLPVDRNHIIGHVEVPGTDHTDPGPHWDWDRYIPLVRKAAEQAAKTASAPPTGSA